MGEGGRSATVLSCVLYRWLSRDSSLARLSMVTAAITIKAFFKRLAVEEGGQELIEYAILTAFIAAGSVLLFAQLANTMNSAYANPVNGFNQATQDAWEPCPPGVSPPCP